MIVLDNYLIDDKIGSTPFLCDLSKCKGGCCTIPGEVGAPLLDDEIEVIEKCLPHAIGYLDDRSKNILASEGFYQGEQGDYSTVVINNHDCVFVYYENDIAFCAIEKAYLDGKIDYKKPISCHLFPIRVGYFGGKYLYYDKMSVCNPAIENGKEKNVMVYQSVKEAVVRAFGEDWYNQYLDKLKEVK